MLTEIVQNMDLDLANTTIGATVLMVVSWIFGYYSLSVLWVWAFVSLVAYSARLWRRREKRLFALQYVAVREKEAIMSYLKEDIPEWVRFPDSERVEWMNRVFRQLWPYISEYAVLVFKETLEPGIRANMPAAFSGLQFDKVDIGDTALRVEAIRVYRGEEAGHGRVTMDIDIEYDGDCEFVISVNILTAGVRKVKMKGRLRVILVPLVPRSPIIEAVSLFFLAQPTIAFDLTGLGELLQLPALSRAVKEVLNKQISDMCVLPNQVIVPLTPDADVVRLYTPELDGAVRIYILEAQNLENRDIGFLGMSDPYAKVSVGAQSHRTGTRDNELNPVWNEIFEAVVHHVSGQQLRIEIYDEDPGPDDFLGDLELDLAMVKERGFVDEWFPLNNASSGQIHLALTWLDMAYVPSVDDGVDQSIQSNRNDLFHTALLMAYVDKAVVKAPPHGSHKLSPFIELQIGNQKQQTVAKTTLDPVYQEKFFFFVSFSEDQVLQLQVKDCTGNHHNKIAQGKVPLRDLLKEDKLELYQGKVPLITEQSSNSTESYVMLSLRLRFLHSSTNAEAGLRKMISAGSDFNKRHSDGFLGGVRMGIDNVLRPINSGSVKNILAKRKSLWQKRKAKSLPHIGDANENLGKVQLTIQYSSEWNNLAVIVHQVSGMHPCSEEQNADPFVQLQIKRHGSITAHYSKRSSVIYDTLNPTFDEAFEFKLPESELKGLLLIVKLKDAIKYKLFTGKPTLGKISFDLSLLTVVKPVVRKWFDFGPPHGDAISKLQSMKNSRMSLATE